MKKRNKPILLLTILAVFVGIAAIINATSVQGHDHDHDAQAAATPPANTPVTGDKRESVSKDELAAATASSVGQGGAVKVPGPETETGPMVLDPRRSGELPKPHTSTMGSGWYTDEGAKDYKIPGG
jgi:hypothetical protein